MSNRLYSFRVNTDSDAEMVAWLEERKNISAWVKKAIHEFMSKKRYVYDLSFSYEAKYVESGERITTHTRTDWPSIGGLTTNDLHRIARSMFLRAVENDSRFAYCEGLICTISISQSMGANAFEFAKLGYVEPMIVTITL
jgi:hypothetical protein